MSHSPSQTTILKTYFSVASTPSDIYEHLAVLASYTSQCRHVIECGVSSCVSTWAFLAGLLANGQKEKTMIGVDIVYHPNIVQVERLCEQPDCPINYRFIHGNSATVELPETDLLFIDTWHVAAHLKRELAAHHAKVRKWIIMHDTTVDGVYGETIRRGLDAEKQAKESGYPIEEIRQGLWNVVEQFLVDHPEWVIERKYTNCNGLTILKRRM